MSDQLSPGLGSEAFLQSFLVHHRWLGQVQHRQRVHKWDQPLSQLWERPELLGGIHFLSTSLPPATPARTGRSQVLSLVCCPSKVCWRAAERGELSWASRSSCWPAFSVFIGGVSLLSGVQELDWAICFWNSSILFCGDVLAIRHYCRQRHRCFIVCARNIYVTLTFILQII